MSIEKTGIELKELEPIRDIPENLINDYTLNGSIRIIKWWFNGIKIGESENFYSKKEIDLLVKEVKEGKYLKHGYQNTDPFLYDALRIFSMENNKILVLGSEKPTYESICLSHGAKPTTLEYKIIKTDHPDLNILTVDEYNSKLRKEKFDMAISISSIEHDGLGRYGDPLNPNGDLETMSKLKKMIRRDGLLFLAVPIGIDTVYWNAGRWYGKIRLPLLLKEWELVESFGFEQYMLDEDYPAGSVKYNQPVFVLRNSK